MFTPSSCFINSSLVILLLLINTCCWLTSRLRSAWAGQLKNVLREPKLPKEHYRNFSCSRDGKKGGGTGWGAFKVLRWPVSGIGSGAEVYMLFFLCFFHSLIFWIGLEQTSFRMNLSLITKAIQVHEKFRQYRKKGKSKKALTIFLVPVKFDSFQILFWCVLLMKIGSHCIYFVLLPFPFFFFF